MLTRTLLLFLLVLLVLRAIWRLVNGVVRGASEPGQGGPRRASGPDPVQLMKDPVCGTFVVPGKSPSLVRRGETLYFCSDQCRDTFAGR